MKRVMALAVLAVSCGADNSLGGSVSEIFPLAISNVEVHRNIEGFQVTYYRNRGLFLDIVARVSVPLSDGDGGYVDLKPGVKIDLGGEYAPGHPRVSVTHAPGGEPVRNLPAGKRGDLQVGSGGHPDEATRGDFSLVFEEEGGDIGQGRTLYGNFSAVAIDAGWGVLP